MKAGGDVGRQVDTVVAGQAAEAGELALTARHLAGGLSLDRLQLAEAAQGVLA